MKKQLTCKNNVKNYGTRDRIGNNFSLAQFLLIYGLIQLFIGPIPFIFRVDLLRSASHEPQHRVLFELTTGIGIFTLQFYVNAFIGLISSLDIKVFVLK